jgi:hypothetical protein
VTETETPRASHAALVSSAISSLTMTDHRKGSPDRGSFFGEVIVRVT